MKTRKIGKVLQITLFVALATLTSTSIAFADRVNEAATIAADRAPCEVTWVAENSVLPSDVLDEICFVTETKVAASPIADHSPYEFAWLTDSSAIPLSVLNEISFFGPSELTGSEFDTRLIGPSLPVVEDSWAYFQQYLFATGLTEHNAVPVASPVSSEDSLTRFQQYLKYAK